MGKPKRRSNKKTILITAGPTIEPIDPIRYISNYSTGRMGFELARAARDRGYRVILISGPTSLRAAGGVRFIPVNTALEMKQEVLRFFRYADCVVMAAAVSDFRPRAVSKKKIKKAPKKSMYLKLERNPDILSEIGKRKGRRFLVGYSLETDKPIENAKKKLKAKHLDIVVVNKIGKGENPFGPGSKGLAIIEKGGRIGRIRGLSKRKIANILMSKISNDLPYGG